MASKHNIYKQLENRNILRVLFVAYSASVCACVMEVVSPRE